MIKLEQITGSRFLILPSIFIYDQYYKTNTKSIILEPILGEYHQKIYEPIDRMIHNVVSIKNKIYLFGSNSLLEDNLFNEIDIFSLCGDNIKLVKKLSLCGSYFMLQNDRIQWPIYYDHAYDDKCLIYMIDSSLETLQFAQGINPLFLKVLNKEINMCNRLELIHCTDKNTCIYSYCKRIYESSYVKKNNYIEIASLEDSDLLYANPKYNIYPVPKKLNKDFIVYSDGSVVNIHDGKSCKTDIVNFRYIISDKIWILDDYSDGKVNFTLFIIGDDDDFDKAEKISINNIGFIPIKIINEKCQKNYVFKRIVEDSFKSEERHRLAEWLYNQLGQMLPIVITGLITDFCSTIEYYDYDLLMNFLSDNS